MKKIADILKEHTFFQDLSPEDLEFVAGCGKNAVFKEGEVIASLGTPANDFFLIHAFFDQDEKFKFCINCVTW